MSKSVTVYTTRYCPYCARAKALLNQKGIPFEEIDVTDDDNKRKEIEERYGHMTVPIIVIGDDFIGGADELYQLERSGQLSKKI